MSEPRALVEHFFRHEFGRLSAVLTRSLGVRRLDLVEDVVQAALVQALEIWSRCGVPEGANGPRTKCHHLSSNPESHGRLQLRILTR